MNFKLFIIALLACFTAAAQPFKQNAFTTNVNQTLGATSSAQYPIMIGSSSGTFTANGVLFSPNFAISDTNAALKGILFSGGAQFTNAPTFLSGTASTLLGLNGSKAVASIANGIGVLTNDGAGGMGFSTNVAQAVTYNEVTSTTINSTTINATTINANVHKGGHLTITNEVLFPFVTLTLSGTNVPAMSLTNSSAFKLTLTGDAFVPAATDLPGTNYLGTYQLFIKQDGTGGRAIRFTNSYWVIAGSGTSTNAQPSITTNADAVSILTFSTGPFANKAYGVITATGP